MLTHRPPLIYADQAYSIIKKRDSTGFSHDVCGVVIIANIIRVFFWLGKRFETPLLVQSLLLILSQLLLLSICLHYSPNAQASPGANYAPLSPMNEQLPEHVPEAVPAPHRNWASGLKLGSGRPFDFWQWEGYGTYLEFLAGMIVILGLLQLALGRWMWYIDALGFVALSIESTLPIPQFISNWRRKSTYGLRASTLAGWFFGDAFKTGYFFVRHSPAQFQVTAIMTLCWDTAVFLQRLRYGTAPPAGETRQEAEVEESVGLAVER